MGVLRRLVPATEVYSIDEAFLDFTGMDDADFDALGHRIARTVRRHTGIPVSIGIAPTKTLAKIASKLCKRYPKLDGACFMHRPEDIRKVLGRFPVNDGWGVGPGGGGCWRSRGCARRGTSRTAAAGVGAAAHGGDRPAHVVRAARRGLHRLRGASGRQEAHRHRPARSTATRRTSGSCTAASPAMPPCAPRSCARRARVRRGVGVPAYEPLPRGPAPALRACRAALVRAGRQYARTDRTGRGGCGASIAGVLPKAGRGDPVRHPAAVRISGRPVRCDRPCEARPADGGGRCAQCRIRTPPGRDRRRGCGPLPQHRDRLSRPFTTDWEGCCG